MTSLHPEAVRIWARATAAAEELAGTGSAIDLGRQPLEVLESLAKLAGVRARRSTWLDGPLAIVTVDAAYAGVAIHAQGVDDVRPEESADGRMYCGRALDGCSHAD
jgi:hypothetical protein